MREALVVLLLAIPALAGAQQMERVTFEEAIRRAVAANPTMQEAEASIRQAQAVLQQVRANALPRVAASFETDVIDPVTRFDGASIVPRTQTLWGAVGTFPLFVPVRWAERKQAADQVGVAERDREAARTSIADSTGRAYLLVIALRRELELQEAARDNARAHYDYANQRYEGGLGSRLNAVRAQQDLSATETRVEQASIGIVRAQEALGVLIAADGPVDVAGEPAFDLPPAGITDNQLVLSRPDVQVVLAREAAAERVSRDSWKDWLPEGTALLTPQVLAPAGLFANARAVRASVIFAIPVFDSGLRRGEARERKALVEVARAQRTSQERQAASEIRSAREAVRINERALEYARAAARQADEVVQITFVAFREGATSNIEVVDAQRVARDAATSVAIAENAVRQARLELLVATGRFP